MSRLMCSPHEQPVAGGALDRPVGRPTANGAATSNRDEGSVARVARRAPKWRPVAAEHASNPGHQARGS